MYTGPDAHTHAYGNADRNTYAGSYGNADRNTYAGSYGNADIYSHADAAADCDPDAAPDTPATSDLNYCLEVALYGTWPVIKKWQTDPLIRVHGNPTTADLDELRRVIGELNMLTGLQIAIVDEDASIDVHFAPRSEWEAIYDREDGFTATQRGYVSRWWPRGTFAIDKALVIIRSTESARVRRHLIREEVTQSLFGSKDATRYPDSIFHNHPNNVTEYADVDRACIRFVYRDDVLPGMTRDDVLALAGR